MRFLAYFDHHGEEDSFLEVERQAADPEVEFLVCGGDFTLFGMDLEYWLDRMNKVGKKTYLIHGNHEHEESVLELLPRFKNLIWIHETSATIRGITFVGYGGGGFAKRDSQFVTFIKQFEGTQNLVFVFHQPPYDTAMDDRYDGVNKTGNADYRDAILKLHPLISLSGHIHESAYMQDMLGDTLLVNPGPTGQIIEIDESKVNDTKSDSE
jgi:Icc-related predicted phosphoesterase